MQLFCQLYLSCTNTKWCLSNTILIQTFTLTCYVARSINLSLPVITFVQVPFTTMLALLCMWLGISVPLVFVGYYFGYRKYVSSIWLNVSFEKLFSVVLVGKPKLIQISQAEINQTSQGVFRNTGFCGMILVFPFAFGSCCMHISIWQLTKCGRPDFYHESMAVRMKQHLDFFSQIK